MGCGEEIIATDGNKVVRSTSHRYQLNGELQKGNVSLTIYSTTQKDSGRYGCRVHVPGWFNDKKIIVDLVIMEGGYPSTTTILILNAFNTKHTYYSQKLCCYILVREVELYKRKVFCNSILFAQQH